MTTQPEQRYCEDTEDHPTHDGVLIRQTGPHTLAYFPVRCPGRHTPRGLTSGAYGDPKPPADPFAGIPDAD